MFVPLLQLTAPDTTPLDALADEIAARASSMAAALGGWLDLVAEFDAREGWGQYGATSCAEWLAWRCSLSPVTAREHVRVARRLQDLPLIGAALRRGELSYSKVRAIARVDRVADEAGLLELARDATASQLERLLRIARRVTREEAAAAIERRFLDIAFDDDGTAVVRGRLPSEDAALLLRALERIDETLRCADGAGRTPEPVGARRADALAWMAANGLGAAEAKPGVAEGPRTTSERTEVLLHVDSRLLSDDAAESDARTQADRGGPCHFDAGAPVAVETARRLCCDGGIVAVVRDGDRTLAVGRRTRAIPPSIRRALRVQRPCCAFPGCNRTRWLDAHHLVHWARGGRTDLDNLVQLCRHHHRLVHEGGWQLVRAEDGAWAARSPYGFLVEESRPRDSAESDVAAPAALPAPPSDLPADRPAALTPRALGERYDLDLAVDAVLATMAPEAMAA